MTSSMPLFFTDEVSYMQTWEVYCLTWESVLEPGCRFYLQGNIQVWLITCFRGDAKHLTSSFNSENETISRDWDTSGGCRHSRCSVFQWSGWEHLLLDVYVGSRLFCFHVFKHRNTLDTDTRTSTHQSVITFKSILQVNLELPHAGSLFPWYFLHVWHGRHMCPRLFLR